MMNENSTSNSITDAEREESFNGLIKHISAYKDKIKKVLEKEEQADLFEKLTVALDHFQSGTLVKGEAHVYYSLKQNTFWP